MAAEIVVLPLATAEACPEESIAATPGAEDDQMIGLFTVLPRASLATTEKACAPGNVLIVIVVGEIAILTATWETLRLAVADLPSIVAVSVEVPSAPAVTRPVVSTVTGEPAAPALHVTVFPLIWFPRASSGVA